MGPIELTFDVTAGLPADVTEGQTVTIAGWLFLPDDTALLGQRPVTMVLLNGGSYDKRYFHVEIPGHPGYSAAKYLASRGNVVLVLDHLGMGGSTRVPHQKRATRQIVALAAHFAASQFHERLGQGTLHPSLGALPDFAKIGAGHSMGAMQTIIQQAGQGTYDAVMILGYTADGVHLTFGGQKVRASTMPLPADPEDYTIGGREGMHETFHWDDVPAEVIAADDALCVETPSEIGFKSIVTGIVAQEAAQIDVPVYICLGERDVSPDPHAEPGYYKASSDITLHILPKSGHCQNLARTRHQMWERMHRWAQCLFQENVQ
jgi:pimeloyl-ACP methyl ester carboxylesterase